MGQINEHSDSDSDSDSADREINLLSLTNLGCEPSLYRVQSALKANMLTHYAYFLHVLMWND